MKNSLFQAFCNPVNHTALDQEIGNGLINASGDSYQFLDVDGRVVDFIARNGVNAFDTANLQMYDAPASLEMYRNFLDWLFQSFDEDEAAFRKKLVTRLNLLPGMKVLVTGCGFGDDIALIHDIVGDQGEIHAQDISKSMVISASQSLKHNNVCFSVSNATALPYKSRYFDAVFHFGGINLFGDIKKSISEMERVCKINGRVFFGDEGIAPHLRETQYAEIAINNNGLWAHKSPINFLPTNAADIELNYVLGNCFYTIGFSPATGLPFMNIDVPHKGTKGGTARTRFIGRQLSVSQESKDKLILLAAKQESSVHAIIEKLINDAH